MDYGEYIAERDREDLRSILKTKWGQRFVWRFMARAGVFQQSFIPGSADGTAFNEGRRSIGLTLLNEVLEVNPEVYLKMTKMAKEDQNVREAFERGEKAD